MKEIGSRTTNREELYFKFVCYPLKPEEKIPINFVPLALD